MRCVNLQGTPTTCRVKKSVIPPNRYVSDGVEHSPVICKRSVDIRLNLTGYAVLSFNLIGCQCVNFRYILLLHQCETVVSHW